MSSAYDPFSQLRDHRGALAIKGVELCEVEGLAELHFTLLQAQEEGAARGGLVHLEDLAAVKPGDAMRNTALKLARKSGPLFGGLARESYESWQLAVLSARRALRFNAAVSNGDITIAQDDVVKAAVMKAPFKKSGCTWLATSFMVNAGGGDDYIAALPQMPWAKRVGEHLWAVCGVKNDRGVLYLTVGVSEFTFDAQLPDIQPFMQALEASGLPCVELSPLIRHGKAPQTPLITANDLAIDVLGLCDDDAPKLKLLLDALVQAHIKDVRFDMVKSNAENKFLAFPSLLSWMWCDFAQRKGRLKMALCPECGMPFSRNGRNGARKSYCSAACRSRAAARTAKRAGAEEGDVR